MCGLSVSPSRKSSPTVCTHHNYYPCNCLLYSRISSSNHCFSACSRYGLTHCVNFIIGTSRSHRTSSQEAEPLSMRITSMGYYKSPEKTTLHYKTYSNKTLLNEGQPSTTTVDLDIYPASVQWIHKAFTTNTPHSYIYYLPPPGQS
jgi:hypothetical protein